LLKARELLRDSSTKIIDVALESGFRHLSLFNAMFKRRFGTTPSGWREQKAARKAARRRSSGRSLIAVLLALGLGASLSAAVAAPTPAAPAPVAPAPAAPATSTNGPTFEVKGFQVEGNTLLKPEIIDESLAPYITNHASFDTLRAALTALQLTYRARGWVTVSVGLPPQQLTNGLVKVAVTEGRLTEIQVVGNRHFSSNNIMSALPSLSTNVYLNSAWFQPELDNANANRDRQIYPVISPGPDPGTTALTLKVKDRLPLHGRLEMDNYGPYGTPPDRIDATVQYNNLWQADHQIGVQYNFSPSQTKVENQMPRFWNQPADVAYSAFYRFPVGPQRALLAVPEFNVNDFGYDPATRRFKAPPATGRPEIIVFASRSDNDSGIKLGPVIPVSESPLVTVASQASGQDLTVNAGAGGRFSYPLPVLGPLRSVASFGPDWKHYSLNSYNTNTFFFRIIQTNDNEPVIIERTKAFPQDALIRNLDYLPLTLGWNGQISDPFGSTSFNLSESANAADLNTETFLGTNNLANAPGAGNYFITRMQASRDQRIHGDWGITLRADGQWANQAIINNEQFGLGGSAGVRGYRENEEYGDSGWRGSFEPHTPYFELGRGANTQVLRVRFVAFMDYGQRFLKEATVRDEKLAQWGVGFGGKVTLGEFFEVNVQLGWALLDTPVTQAGTMRTYFSVAGQF
jgi:hemolysin activation/secretion protein